MDLLSKIQFWGKTLLFYQLYSVYKDKNISFYKTQYILLNDHFLILSVLMLIYNAVCWLYIQLNAELILKTSKVRQIPINQQKQMFLTSLFNINVANPPPPPFFLVFPVLIEEFEKNNKKTDNKLVAHKTLSSFLH